jgi:hypothetical protein
MRTPQWIKNLGGHAGEHFVCAELSKRGIPNALLPENFPHDDIMVSDRDGMRTAYIQVKACHPDRSKSFILREANEAWCSEPPNKFCVFVWLGAPGTYEPPRYWIALKSEVGEACIRHPAHMTENWERRFFPHDFPQHWENRWSLFDTYRPAELSESTTTVSLVATS